jgi:flavodoxin
MRSLIVYDSWYGNTERIAEAIARGIGDESLVVKVDADPKRYLRGDQLLLVGSPTHGGVATPEMHEFLNTLGPEELRGARFATFDTRINGRWLRVVGFASDRIAKQLSAKGGSLVIHPEGFYVHGKEGPLLDGEIERAEQWAVQLANQVKSEPALHK